MLFCVRRWQFLNRFTCKQAKALQSALRKFQRFPRSLWAGTLSLGDVMKEGQCCNRGNVPRTRMSGSRLPWPKLAKPRSGLVPTFHRWEEKLLAPFGSNSSAARLLDVSKWLDISSDSILAQLDQVMTCLWLHSKKFQMTLTRQTWLWHITAPNLVAYVMLGCECSLPQTIIDTFSPYVRIIQRYLSLSGVNAHIVLEALQVKIERHSNAAPTTVVCPYRQNIAKSHWLFCKAKLQMCSILRFILSGIRCIVWLIICKVACSHWTIYFVIGFDFVFTDRVAFCDSLRDVYYFTLSKTVVHVSTEKIL